MNCTQNIAKQKRTHCPLCKQKLDFKKFYFLKDKDKIPPISHLFTPFEEVCKKFVENINFQRVQYTQYIKSLETRLNLVNSENKNLKSQIEQLKIERGKNMKNLSQLTTEQSFNVRKERIDRDESEKPQEEEGRKSITPSLNKIKEGMKKILINKPLTEQLSTEVNNFYTPVRRSHLDAKKVFSKDIASNLNNITSINNISNLNQRTSVAAKEISSSRNSAAINQSIKQSGRRSRDDEEKQDCWG